jgi:hypothetical protein
MSETNRFELLTALAMTVDRGAIDFDPDQDLSRYIDWSVETGEGRSFELGAGGDQVVVDLTWAEITRLQRALTVLLLERG